MAQEKDEPKSIVNNLKKDIHNEEMKLKKEIKMEEAGLRWFFKSHTFRIILILLVFTFLMFGLYYVSVKESRIYVENSRVSAPIIKLTSSQPGILQKIYVKLGDSIPANTIVAQVGDVQIKSKVAGIVINVQNTPGQFVTAQNTIVEMIDPTELRVIGRVEENKGLDKIKIGQKVIFTADAFSSKEYIGVVDSISPAARSGDIVFSISDKREEQEYEVYVQYPVSAYPELKQGMSAKMWIYK